MRSSRFRFRHRALFLLLFLAAALLRAQVAPPRPAEAPEQDKTHISKQQADELFRSVDEILKWVSQDTGLPIKHPVKRALASRTQVQKYVEEHMKDDEDAQRLARSELVLKKFGLVPREFDLGKFLVQLLREQVVGFYDPKKKTVFLLDWVEPDAQKPVLAHELTHALQDQNYELEKWQRAGMPSAAEERKAERESEKDAATERRNLASEIAADELQTARQAVTEGQGMAVLIDYMLAPMHRTIVDSPELVEQMKRAMTSTNDSPVFARAPLALQLSLTFPYRYGLGFEQTLLKRGGKEMAFAHVMESPPTTSRQVLEPLRYVSKEHVPALPVFAVGNLLGPQFERFDVGAIGEFDLYLLSDAWSGEEDAARVAPTWRGGYYYAAAEKRAKGAAPPKTTADVKLLYVSRWDSEQSAHDFAEFYAKSLEKRYTNVQPSVSRAGEAVAWRTSEGLVTIFTSGDRIVITEGFEPTVAQKLREAALKAEAAP